MLIGVLVLQLCLTLVLLLVHKYLGMVWGLSDTYTKIPNYILNSIESS